MRTSKILSVSTGEAALPPLHQLGEEMVHARKASHCINVMESVVADEVDKHLKTLPVQVVKYIKRSEIETFALNRLPALYASSERGFQHQRERALTQLKPQVVNAVRQALAAVQVDPIRCSQPIQFEQASESAEAVLQALKTGWKAPDLTWETALNRLQKMQRRRVSLAQDPPSGRPKTVASSSVLKSKMAVEGEKVTPSKDSGIHRPGTYGSTRRQPRQPSAETVGGFEESYLR